jgi:hypothetical protein
MAWNYVDRLEATARQVIIDGTAETTYYVYDSSGQRVRKVTERQSGPTGLSTRIKERLYLGAAEVYREYSSAGTEVDLERQTLHVMDGQYRIAMGETRTKVTRRRNSCAINLGITWDPKAWNWMTLAQLSPTKSITLSAAPLTRPLTDC